MRAFNNESATCRKGNVALRGAKSAENGKGNFALCGARRGLREFRALRSATKVPPWMGSAFEKPKKHTVVCIVGARALRRCRSSSARGHNIYAPSQASLHGAYIFRPANLRFAPGAKLKSGKLLVKKLKRLLVCGEKFGVFEASKNGFNVIIA